MSNQILLSSFLQKIQRDRRNKPKNVPEVANSLNVNLPDLHLMLFSLKNSLGTIHESTKHKIQKIMDAMPVNEDDMNMNE